MATGQQPRTFNEVRARLEEIVEEVRDKELSLEKSLDLYEEAIRLGNRCSDLLDKADYSPEEAAALAEARVAEAEDFAGSNDSDESSTPLDSEPNIQKTVEA